MESIETKKREMSPIIYFLTVAQNTTVRKKSYTVSADFSEIKFPANQIKLASQPFHSVERLSV